MKIQNIIRFFFILIAFECNAQELLCRVVVDRTQTNVSDPSVFDSMEKDIAEFMNNRRWTSDEFQLDERIKCNFLLTITSVPSTGVYEATVQIISARPIYGTDYESILFNYADREWAFSYVPSRPIQFNENSFVDNLSSLLSYYAYVIIGMDYDSFSDFGGDQHFQKAFRILNNAQQSNYPGWQQLGSNRNRYWLIENIQNPSLKPIRHAIYSYHRLGMDVLKDKPDEARNVIAEALQGVQTANRARPRSILTISFVDAKATELAHIYSEGSPTIRKKAYGILTAIDPSKAEVFKPMIE